MENKQTKSIGRSLLTGISTAVVAICVVLGVVGYRMYSNGMTDRYQAYLRDLLTLTLGEIDGDDLRACIDSRQESEAFERANDFLDKVRDSYDIEYIYVVVPLNTEASDNMMDVMSGMSTQERLEDEEFYSVTLGNLTGQSYPADVAAKYLDGMESDDVTYFGNNTEFGYDYTGMIPIRDSDGTAVALLCADVSMSVIEKTLSTYLIFVVIFTIALAALTVVVLYRWLHRRVVAPLARLKDVSERFVASSHDAKSPDDLVVTDSDIHTQDEMEALSVSLNDMFGSMKRYMSDLVDATRERERIGAELGIATKIQQDMLPRIFPAFPRRPEFDIYASMDPAKEVGGDFYDLFLIDEDHLGLVMADVSSKGVPAALFMVIAKTLIKSHLQSGESPATALMNVNNELAENNEAGFFVTVWAAVLEISTGKGIAVNAGHEHPVVRRGDGPWELVVYKHGIVCGVMEGLRYREHEFELNPGDRVFVYTDGVPESQNAAGELYGTDRMVEALNETPDAGPEEMLRNVRANIDAFVGDAEQFDDLTMLFMRYDGPQE